MTSHWSVCQVLECTLWENCFTEGRTFWAHSERVSKILVQLEIFVNFLIVSGQLQSRWLEKKKPESLYLEPWNVREDTDWVRRNFLMKVRGLICRGRTEFLRQGDRPPYNSLRSPDPNEKVWSVLFKILSNLRESFFEFSIFIRWHISNCRNWSISVVVYRNRHSKDYMLRTCHILRMILGVGCFWETIRMSRLWDWEIVRFKKHITKELRSQERKTSCQRELSLL